MAESAGKMYVLATVLSIWAIVATMLRFYARRMKRIAISWDDYTILLALLFTIGTAICMFIGTAIGNLGQHTGMENGAPVFDHRLKVFEQIIFASLLTQTLTFGFTKLSVLLFYKRIFVGKTFVISVWVMIVIISLWTFAFFLANLLQCTPFSQNWTDFGLTVDQCINTRRLGHAEIWSDVLTDVVILSLPLPYLWKLQMPTKHKIGISGMFLLGALTVGAGIAKLVVFTDILHEMKADAIHDISYFNTPIVYWPMVESSLGIVGACLPMLRPLFVGTSLKCQAPIQAPESDQKVLIVTVIETESV